MNGFRVFIVGAVILILIGLIFSLTGEKSQFLVWLAYHRYPVSDYYFYYVTLLGEEYGFIVAGILLWFYSWKKMITIPILGGIVVITSYVLKSIFEHERPVLYLDRICYEGPLSVLGYPMLMGHHGFPSGHSMAAWALFTLIAAYAQKTWISILCLFLAFSVSISRIYLMAHFLEDVEAGAMIGIALGYGIYYAYLRWTNVKA
jgi:membrane-associated phospholipid phosphatase